MEKLLTVLGTLVAASAIGYGVVHADSRAAGKPPAPAPGKALPGGPAPAPVPAPAPSPAPAPATSSGALDWASLTSYEYQQGMANLPEALKALDGKTVTLRGFLLPLYEFDEIKEFILVANHMSCCFGIPAGINGQIYVKSNGERGLPNTNEPIEVVGTFHARERTEQGYVLSIFEIVDAKPRIVGY